MDSLTTVADFSTNPHEVLKFFNPPKITDCINNCNKILDGIISTLAYIHLPDIMSNNDSSYEFRPESKVNKYKKIITSLQNNLAEMGLYGGYRATLHHMVQLELLMKESDDFVRNYKVIY